MGNPFQIFSILPIVARKHHIKTLESNQEKESCQFSWLLFDVQTRHFSIGDGLKIDSKLFIWMLLALLTRCLELLQTKTIPNTAFNVHC